MNTRSFSTGLLLFLAIIAIFMGELDVATHTAVEVPITASGPGSERMSHGKLDNTQVFDIFDGGLGPFTPVLWQK